jgi:WD40 repeat protein
MLWDCEEGVPINELEFHQGVQALHFSPDGKYLASLDIHEPALIVWSVETGKIISTYVVFVTFANLKRGHTPTTTYDVRWIVGKGRELITVGDDAITFWLLDEQLLIQKAEIDKSLFNCPDPNYRFHWTCVTSWDQWIFCGGKDGIVVIFNGNTNTMIQIWLDVAPCEISTMSIHRNHIIIGSDSVRRWGYRKKEPFEFTLREEIKLDGQVISMTMNEQGTEGVVGTSTSTIFYINFDSQTCVRIVNSHNSPISSIACSNFVASCAENARLWDNKNQVLQFESKQNEPSSVCLATPYLIIAYTGHITVHHLTKSPNQKLIKNSITLHNEQIRHLFWCDGLIFAGGGGRVDVIEYRGIIYEGENHPIQGVVNFK